MHTVRDLLRRVREQLRRSLRRLRSHVQGRQAHRKQARYVGKTIAITGSVGKTTATWLTRKLLSADHTVAASYGFRNGGWTTIELMRSLAQPADYAVEEVAGVPFDGFEAVLRDIAIDVAVVTRIGLDHASEFRTVEAVAEHKGRLVEKVLPNGVVCLNADDPLCRGMASRTRARVVLYGTAADADLRAEAVDATWPGRLSFELVVGGRRRRVATRFVGTLFLPSVLASLAVVHGLGLDLDAAVARLGSIRPAARRLSVVESGPSGHAYVLDTYKASYWSTLALVADLEHWGPARRIVVLGEMSDIRSESSRRYRQVVRALAKHAALVIGIGRAESAARRLPELPNVVPAATVADAARILAEEPPSLVILKSNKTVRLDTLAGRDRAGDAEDARREAGH